jgi:hypothetical protein
MEKKWCSSCGIAFEPRAQTPRQTFCPKDECQLARKRLWQRAKRTTDKDYRENQAAAQELWRSTHPDYWRKYRKEHPDYADANRERQKIRNARRCSTDSTIAKVDASDNLLPTEGIFKLVLLDPSQRGPIREWTVHLTLLLQSKTTPR